MEQQVQNPNRFLVAAIVILAGVLFTMLQIQQSIFQGQLSLPITFDDIGYFVDALRRLHRIYDQGLPRLILDWFERPPHSPTSTLTPLLGFALFGAQDWAPAAANGLYLIGLLFFIAYLTAHLSWLYRMTIALIVLTCPLAGHLIIESRPDILCGLATACASFLLLSNSASEERHKQQILAGAMAGLAFLAKPSISPVTVIILSSVVFAITFRNWLHNRRLFGSKSGKRERLNQLLPILRSLRQYAPFVVVVLLMSLPHYLIAIKHILWYIHLTMFGANKELWQTDYPAVEQVLYYISGAGGKMMFGAWGSVVVLVVLLTFAAMWLTQDWQRIWKAVPYLGVISITYLLVTIPSTKSPFLGMLFGAMILLSVIYLLIYIAQGIESRSHQRFYRIFGQAACIALIVISLSSFQWPWFHRAGSPRAGTVAQATYEQALLNAISQQLEEKLGKASPQCAPRIAFTTQSNYLNEWTLEYQLLKQGFANFTVLPVISSSSDLKVHWQSIRNSNYVVAFSLDNPTRITWLPVEEVQPQLLKKLNSARRFKLIETFDRPELLGSGKVFLYRAAQRCKPLPENPLIK